jgi:hypothetical protein
VRGGRSRRKRKAGVLRVCEVVLHAGLMLDGKARPLLQLLQRGYGRDERAKDESPLLGTHPPSPCF